MAERFSTGMHSIQFGPKNSYVDWHLVYDGRPEVASPNPKTNYVSVPGMSGSLDYTEVLSGLNYEDRTGSWRFFVMGDYWGEAEIPDTETNFKFKSWDELYADILETIHGRRLIVWLEDDPNYVYFGRVSVNWNSEKDYSQITVQYTFEPYKRRAKFDENGYPITDFTKYNQMDDGTGSTASNNWLWDEIPNVTIIYGSFKVDGEKKRTMYNPNDAEIEIAVQCTSAMTVDFNGQTIYLQQGRNKNSGIKLQNGTNEMTFHGNGSVIVDYDKDGISL